MALKLIKRIQKLWHLSDLTPVELKETKKKQQATIIKPNNSEKILKQIENEQK